MENGAIFIQFSTFQEALFAFQYGYRSKNTLETADTLSQITSIVLCQLRFLIELFQLIPLVYISGNLMTCYEGGIQCGIYYVATPFNALSHFNEASNIVFVLLSALISISFFIFVALSASNFRKREVNTVKFSWIETGYWFFGLVYFTDILTLFFNQFNCNLLYNIRGLDKGTCEGAGHYVSMILSGFGLVALLPLMSILTITSPIVDAKRIPGRVASVRVDLAAIFVKVYLAIQYTVVLSLEDSDGFNEDNTSARGLRIGAHSISILFFLLLTAYQVVQCPHTRDSENRSRAGLYGACFSLSITSLIAAIAPDLGLTSLWHAIFATSIALFMASIAMFRKVSLGKMFQLDVNAMSGNFSQSYAADLLSMVHEDLQQLHDTSDATKQPVQSQTVALMISQANSKVPGLSEFYKIKDDAADNALASINKQFAPSPRPTSINNMAGNQQSSQQFSVHNGGRFNNTDDLHAFSVSSMNQRILPGNESVKSANQTLNQSVGMRSGRNNLFQLNHDHSPLNAGNSSDIPSPRNIHATSVSNNQNNNNSSMPSNNMQIQVYSPSHAPTTHDENLNNEEENTGLMSAASRHRLIAYTETQNFSSIRKSLIFDADIELLLRSLNEEWPQLSPAQREIARACVLQLLAALYLRSSSGVAVKGSYFIWIASVCLFLFSDTSTTLHAVKLGADASTSLDTLFLCFLLQKSAEEARNNALQGANRSKRSGGVADLASFRRWTTTARTQHEKALHQMRKFFKTLLAGGSNRLSGVDTNQNMSSNDIKYTTDCRKSLRDALGLIHSTESAYVSLLQRYPSAGEAIQLMTGFKRQFFRDEGDKNTSREGFSTEDGTNSQSSMGSGLAESPKQQRVMTVEQVVSKTFTLMRVVTVFALLAVIALTVFFTMMNISEVSRVTTLINSFEDTASAFIAWPQTCIVTRRAVSGIREMSTNFFGGITTTGPDELQAVIDSSISLNAYSMDTTPCENIILDIARAISCSIVWSDGTSVTVDQDDDGNVIAGTAIPSDFLSATADLTDPYRWWNLTSAAQAAGTVTKNAFDSVNGFVFDSDSNIVSKFAAIPILFAFTSAGPSVQASPPLQGVIYVNGVVTSNDEKCTSNLSEIEPQLTSLRTLTNQLSATAEKLNMDQIIDTLSESIFEVDSYDSVTLAVSSSLLNFAEVVASFSSSALSTKQTVEASYNFTKVEANSDYRFVSNLCSSPIMKQTEIVLDQFSDHLQKFVSQSLVIVTVCALSACFAAILGGIVTIKLVRLYLFEFDRSDKCSVALGILASLPRIELRRIARNVAALRIDKGVLDPDDERAANLDLRFTRKSQRYITTLNQVAAANAAIKVGDSSDIDELVSTKSKQSKMTESRHDQGINESVTEDDDNNNQKNKSNNNRLSPNRSDHNKMSPRFDTSGVSSKNLTASSPSRVKSRDNAFFPVSPSSAISSMPPAEEGPLAQMPGGARRYADAESVSYKPSPKIFKSTASSQYVINKVSDDENDDDFVMPNSNSKSVSTLNPSLKTKKSKKHNRGGDTSTPFTPSPMDGVVYHRKNVDAMMMVVEHSVSSNSSSSENVDDVIGSEDEAYDAYVGRDDQTMYGVVHAGDAEEAGDLVDARMFAELHLLNKERENEKKRREEAEDLSDAILETGILIDNTGNVEKWQQKRATKKGVRVENNTTIINKIDAGATLASTASNSNQRETSPTAENSSSFPPQFNTKSKEGKETSTAHFGKDNVNFQSTAAMLEDSTSASTRRSTPSDIFHLALFRLKVWFRRPISRIFFFMWFIVALYIIINLIISRDAVGSYSIVYYDIEGLMRVSFSAALASLFSISIIGGSSSMAWRTQDFDYYVDQFSSNYSGMRTQFVSAMEKVLGNGKTTVGRRTQERSSLLYEANCLSRNYFGCGDDRPAVYQYDDEDLMTEGLTRAVIAFSSKADNILQKYGDGSNTQQDAYTPEYWFLCMARDRDLEYGFQLLRGTFADEAQTNVDSDIATQYITLSVGIVIIVLMFGLMEITIRHQQKELKDALLLLKMIPARHLDDYRVIERVFDLQDEDDFGVISNNAATSANSAAGNQMKKQ